MYLRGDVPSSRVVDLLDQLVAERHIGHGGIIPLDVVLPCMGREQRGMLVAGTDKGAPLLVGDREEVAGKGVTQTLRGFCCRFLSLLPRAALAKS